MDNKNDNDILFPADNTGPNPSGKSPAPEKDGSDALEPELNFDGGEKPKPLSLNKFIKKKESPAEKPVAGVPPSPQPSAAATPEKKPDAPVESIKKPADEPAKSDAQPAAQPAENKKTDAARPHHPSPEKTEAKGPVKLGQSHLKPASDKDMKPKADPPDTQARTEQKEPVKLQAAASKTQEQASLKNTAQPDSVPEKKAISAEEKIASMRDLASQQKNDTPARMEPGQGKQAPESWPPQSRQPHIHPKPLSTSNASAGHMLQEARVHAGLSIEQVSVRTKIKKDYLLALERDDFPSLPAPVFITAYIKTLSELYGIRESEGDILQKIDRKDGGRRVPGEIIQHVQEGRQVNTDEEEKVRRIFITVLTIIVALIVVGIIYMTYLSTYKYRKAPVGQATAQKTENYKFFSQKIEEKFMVPQTITMDELPVTEKSSGTK